MFYARIVSSSTLELTLPVNPVNHYHHIPNVCNGILMRKSPNFIFASVVQSIFGCNCRFILIPRRQPKEEKKNSLSLKVFICNIPNCYKYINSKIAAVSDSVTVYVTET